MNGIERRRHRAQLARDEVEAIQYPSEVFVVSIKGVPTEVVLSEACVRECIRGQSPHEVRVALVPIRWDT